MANIEIRLPSDFSLTQEGKDQLLSVAKRVDVLDGKVLMYLDEVRKSVSLHVSDKFRMKLS